MREILPSVQSGVVGYSHSFSRYFELNGQEHDRIPLIEEHGILAPAEAKRRGVPYSKNLKVVMSGVPDYDEFIFVFPILQTNSPAIPFGSGVLLSADLPVLTAVDMRLKYDNKWIVASRIFGGELYVPRRIGPEYFTRIIS